MRHAQASVFYNDEQETSGQCAFEDVVDSCPTCKKSGTPILRSASIASIASEDQKLWLTYQCPAKSCHSIFLSEFIAYRTNSGGLIHRYIRSFPAPFSKQDFPKEIEVISPLFGTIYNQAAQSESLGLDHIAGPGYRKALEFLVKDYSISAHPDKAAEIKKKLLARCIDEYITDPKVKRVAALATWLGNDETHYERRWENKDITDLKHLIRLTILAIEAEILAAQYEKEMAPKKA